MPISDRTGRVEMLTLSLTLWRQGGDPAAPRNSFLEVPIILQCTECLLRACSSCHTVFFFLCTVSSKDLILWRAESTQQCQTNKRYSPAHRTKSRTFPKKKIDEVCYRAARKMSDSINEAQLARAVDGVKRRRYIDHGRMTQNTDAGGRPNFWFTSPNDQHCVETSMGRKSYWIPVSESSRKHHSESEWRWEWMAMRVSICILSRSFSILIGMPYISYIYKQIGFVEESSMNYDPQRNLKWMRSKIVKRCCGQRMRPVFQGSIPTRTDEQPTLFTKVPNGLKRLWVLDG